jgi:hypothetical protein
VVGTGGRDGCRAGTAEMGNEVQGAVVVLQQVSRCSPAFLAGVKDHLLPG